MSKKLKLSLGSLKVQSFVTSLDPKESGKVKAGDLTAPTGCAGSNCDSFCGETACGGGCQTIWPGCAPATCACDTAETACQYYCPTFQAGCPINPE